MTDNEIIKALELCITCTITDFSACEKCPYNGKCGESDTHIWKDSLSLINRQKEEIEAYKHYYNECLKDLKNAHAEINELKKENFELKDGYFQKRYEETEHQELMGLREAYRRVDKESNYFQLEAMNLKEENNELTKKYTFLVKENNAISKALFEIDRELRTYSDNAIKEFAKRLKENAASYEVTTAYAEDEEVEAVEVKVINNLVKEMVIDWNEMDSLKEAGDFMSEHPEEITSLNIRIEQQEAVKEFAERLKALKIKPEFPWDDFYVTETAIDNLVKEMTGEK